MATPFTCNEAIKEQYEIAAKCIDGGMLHAPTNLDANWCECMRTFVSSLEGCENEPLLGANIREGSQILSVSCVAQETSDRRWIIPGLIAILLAGILLYVIYLYVCLRRKFNAPRFSVEQLMEDPEESKANSNCFHCRGKVEEKYCSNCGRLLSKWKRRSGVEYCSNEEMNVV